MFQYPARYHTLWEPDQWKKGRNDLPLPRNRDAPQTAKGKGQGAA